MKIEKIQQTFLTPKTTGYAATAGIIATIYSGLSKNPRLRKAHKPLGWITAGLTTAHIALVEYLHYKYKIK